MQGGNLKFLNVIPNLVTYHWKGLVTRKLITLRTDFYDLVCKMVKFDRLSIFPGCHFR